MRSTGLLDLILTNKEVLIWDVKVKGSLRGSDYEMTEFRILRAERSVKSTLMTLKSFFKDLLERVL